MSFDFFAVPFIRFAQLLRYAPGFRYGPRHLYDHLLLYYIAGEGEVILDGVAHEAKSDTLFLVPPRVLNAYITGAHEQTFIGIHFDWKVRPDSARFETVRPAEEPFDESLFRKPQNVPNWDWNATPFLDLRGRPRVRYLLHEVVAAYQAPDEYSRPQAGAFLAAAMAQIAREVDLIADLTRNPHLGADAIRRAHRARELLESAPKISVAQVAALVDWTPDHLARICQTVFSISPRRIHALSRLRRACKLLDHGSASVSDVAFDCGYADTSHFISVFKREFGVTPREYACEKLKKENR